MPKSKNKLHHNLLKPNLTLDSPVQLFLLEKQALSSLNLQKMAGGKEWQSSYKAGAGEKGQVAKRRGRLQEKKWSSSQTMKLFQLHNQLGNKWKEISRFFPDRSDNNVKNHFFSKLRLSLRQLNKVIIKLLGAKKQIKSHILYKITSICELKFKDSSNEKLSLIQLAVSLKNKILNFGQNVALTELAMDIWENTNIFGSKITHHKARIRQADQPKSDQSENQEFESHLNHRETQSTANNRAEIKELNQLKMGKNVLLSINEEDFVLPRNLTPNEKLLLNIPPQLQFEKIEEYVEKPAIMVPENLFLSPIHSFQDSVFSLNISDQSYFSQNQNIAFYTDLLTQKRPQYYGVQKNTL